MRGGEEEVEEGEMEEEGEAEAYAESGSSLVPRLCGGECGVSVWGGREGRERGSDCRYTCSITPSQLLHGLHSSLLASLPNE